MQLHSLPLQHACRVAKLVACLSGTDGVARGKKIDIRVKRLVHDWQHLNGFADRLGPEMRADKSAAAC